MTRPFLLAPERFSLPLGHGPGCLKSLSIENSALAGVAGGSALPKSIDLCSQFSDLLDQPAFGPAAILNGYIKPIILSRNAVHILGLTTTLERFPAADIT